MISADAIPDFKKKLDVAGAFVECEGRILLLKRHEAKPQGNTWGAPGGKADTGEDAATALARELFEETGIVADPSDFSKIESYFVRYPELDFMYHVYRLRLDSRPSVTVAPREHTEFRWVEPKEALSLELIPDEDWCVRWAYGI